MGMFDYIRSDLVLPGDPPAGLELQTKSLVCWLDNYEIREDGTLWHEEYDIEDRSEPDAVGIGAFRGVLTAVNKRWSRVDVTQEVEFHGWDGEAGVMWRWSAYFLRGELRELHLIEPRP